MLFIEFRIANSINGSFVDLLAKFTYLILTSKLRKLKNLLNYFYFIYNSIFNGSFGVLWVHNKLPKNIPESEPFCKSGYTFSLMF